MGKRVECPGCDKSIVIVGGVFLTPLCDDCDREMKVRERVETEVVTLEGGDYTYTIQE